MYKLSSGKFILHKIRHCLVVATSALQPLSKKKYIVFGCGFRKYSGYSRNLFSLLLNDPIYNTNIYWVCNNDSELQELKKLAPNNLIYKYSLKWWAITFHSKAYIFTHDTTDISPVTYSWIKAINLWHGRPIKKIGYDSPVERNWIEEKSKKGLEIPYSRWDYVFSYDSAHSKIIEQCWRIPTCKIIEKSPPGPSHNILNPNTYSKYAFVILYAPTFREYMSEFALLRSPEVRLWLEKNNVAILFRGHPSRGKKLNTEELHPNIINVTTNPNIYEIFLQADLLITDYSSIVFDFLEFKKPTLLLWDGLEKYSETYSLYLNKSDINPSNLILQPIELSRKSIIELKELKTNPFTFILNQELSKEELSALL
ncbi:CDP-glycerol glycerophosphotransferase family protein [Pseudomonas fluorescens]|uniref:Uncharacterized protein n=1 Tax=Pseudomonas fluorescens TaxID=294 RepID=A0A5E7FSE7_PSEFL|nr:CDP-glycerol glycerophosphotransferase family protein [Pseudomonas fluorescens]VVO42259.1 hypothetical protein PS833_05977 [Pseudomonas fluorescens]